MPERTRQQITSRANTGNLGFLLAKASQHWNHLLADAFARRGFPEVRPAYGSLLLPLFEEDGLRMGELATRARLSKQTLTTLARQMERDGLVTRASDPVDGRAQLVSLTVRAREFEAIAERVLAEMEARVEEHLSPEAANALRRGLKGVMEL